MNTKKILGVVAVLALVAVAMVGAGAATITVNGSTATVTAAGDINTVLSDSQYDAITTIALGGNITETSYIDIKRTITIDGNNHTITAGEGTWANNPGKHLIEATTNGAILTLKNVVVDSANNAYGINYWHTGETAHQIDNVTVLNSKGSGITVNGDDTASASLEAKNLKVTGSAWGQSIDIAKPGVPNYSANLTIDSIANLNDAVAISDERMGINGTVTINGAVTAHNGEWYTDTTTCDRYVWVKDIASYSGPSGYEAKIIDGGIAKMYEKLQTAFDAAAVDATVQLVRDVTITAADLSDCLFVNSGKTFVLDLNGKTISNNGTHEQGNGLINIHNGGFLTIKDSVGTGTIDAGTYIMCGILVTYTGDDQTNPAKLTVNGGTIIGNGYGISGNGNRDNSVIIINGGTIKNNKSADGCGIYHPQAGTITVNGGTIEGSVGLQMSGGTAVLNGGSIVSTDVRAVTPPSKDSGETDGSVQDGSAVSMVLRDGYGSVSVTIGPDAVLSVSNTANTQVRLYGAYKPSGWVRKDISELSTGTTATLINTNPDVTAEVYCHDGLKAALAGFTAGNVLLGDDVVINDESSAGVEVKQNVVLTVPTGKTLTIGNDSSPSVGHLKVTGKLDVKGTLVTKSTNTLEVVGGVSVEVGGTYTITAGTIELGEDAVLEIPSNATAEQTQAVIDGIKSASVGAEIVVPSGTISVSSPYSKGSSEFTDCITVNPSSKNTEVKLVAPVAYTFTIPLNADLSTTEGGVVGYSMNITATTADTTKKLNITLDDTASGDFTGNNVFALTNGSNKAYYKVGTVTGNVFTAVTDKTTAPSGNVLLTLNMSTGTSVSGNMGFQTYKLPSVTGTYTGTVKFTVTQTNASA